MFPEATTSRYKSQRTRRAMRSETSKVRHLLATVPPDKAEAAEMIQKGIELWETSSRKS